MNTLIWALAALVVLLDQLSKFFVSRNLAPSDSIEVIKNVFFITLVQNTGAAFGIFKNQTIFFSIVSVAAIFFIIFFIRTKRETSTITDVAIALILGGAFGNLIDRLRVGYVTDFLDFRIWPVFNIADSAITIGSFLLILGILRKEHHTVT